MPNSVQQASNDSPLNMNESQINDTKSSGTPTESNNQKTTNHNNQHKEAGEDQSGDGTVAYPSPGESSDIPKKLSTETSENILKRSYISPLRLE